MVWILFYHAKFSMGNYQLLRFIKSIGYGGVDIFLLCSGYGCYHSYLRDTDVLEFIKRRLKRIYPQMLLFLCIWIPYSILKDHIRFQAILGNLFGIQHFTAQGFSLNWYISALILFYLLTPYFAVFCQRSNLKQNIIMLVFLIFVSFPFWNNNVLIIALSRLPIFYIGMIAAKYQDHPLGIKLSLLLFSAAIAGIICLKIFYVYCIQYMWSFALYWYPFILITPGLCTLLAYLVKFLSKKATRIYNFINYCGKISFELYLIHLLLFSIVKTGISKSILPANNWIWLCTIIISILLSHIFSITSKQITQYISSCYSYGR